MITTIFKSATTSVGHWGLATKAALDALAPLPDGANLGIVYVAETLADDLPSVVTFLRETTPVALWLGGSVSTVLGATDPQGAAPTLAIMAGRVEADALRPFDGPNPAEPAAFRDAHGTWLARQHRAVALVHGAASEPTVGERLEMLAKTSPMAAWGGLTTAMTAPSPDGGTVRHTGLNGALFGDGVDILIGLSQGCQPIGRPHEVTEVIDNVVMTLDGLPALTVLKDEAGEVIARDLKRAAGFIHVALPAGSADDPHAYQVRSLLAIDPVRGWLAVGERLEKGDRLMLVRRDANTAQKDLRRMLRDMAVRLDGRPVKGGLYVSCVARGAHMFGTDDREREMIVETLGAFPLIGFSTPGEICGGRLYGYTGVLGLFV